MLYVLIMWTTWRDVKIPATAEFATQQACQNALITMTTQGFEGTCLKKATGRAE